MNAQLHIWPFPCGQHIICLWATIDKWSIHKTNATFCFSMFQVLPQHTKPQFIFLGFRTLYRTPILHGWINLVKTGLKLQTHNGSVFLVGHAKVSLCNFNVSRTRLFELFSLTGILKVSPYACELGWDVKVTVLLGSDLK